MKGGAAAARCVEAAQVEIIRDESESTLMPLLPPMSKWELEREPKSGRRTNAKINEPGAAHPGHRRKVSHARFSVGLALVGI